MTIGLDASAAAVPSSRMFATRRPIRSALCAATVALSTCAPPPQPWVKPGASGTELRRDLAECEREATGEGPFHFRAWAGDYEAARTRTEERKAACMQGRGWVGAKP